MEYVEDLERVLCGQRRVGRVLEGLLLALLLGRWLALVVLVVDQVWVDFRRD